MDPDFTACMQSKVDMAAESLQQQLFIWTCLRDDLCSHVAVTLHIRPRS